MEGIDGRSSNQQIVVSNIVELKYRLQNLQEHDFTPISQELARELLDKYNISFQEPTPDHIHGIKNLGLHIKLEDSGYKLYSYYFIGVWWLKEREIYIRVFPKERKGKYADSIAMLNEILRDNEITNHKEFKNVFRVNTESSLVELHSENNTFMLFLIIHYLNLLKRLVKKGLRLGYVFIEQGLNGRVKGKVNVKRTYQRYISRGIHTETTCRFQILTQDFLDNQILKTALVQASKYIRLTKIEITGLNDIINYLNYMFENISLKKISDMDFSRVKHSPFFPEYKEAIELARLILKNLGSDPFSHISKSTKVLPYIINMPKLFELYVWSKLKKKYPDVLYQHNANGDIPDFLIESKGLIIDAKYKYIDESKPGLDDIGQLSRYGRNRKIREILLREDVYDKEPILVIAYPVFEDSAVKCSEVEDYHNLYKQAIPIPHYSHKTSGILS